MNFRLTFVMTLLLAIAGFPTMASAADLATISGTVQTGSGAPVDGAQVVLHGPADRSTRTDALGKFTLTQLPQGVYSVSVNAGGYLPASVDDLAVVAGDNVPLAVVLQQADLSSLKTIARVGTSARSSINTGAAAQTFTPAEQFATLANPQINSVVQRIPGAVIERGSSSPNTSISLGGAQGYETQVLLDGHPLSAGRYGVWFSQFFSSWLLKGVETETGPGNTTPFAATAIGGTANFVTPGFTSAQTFDAVTGIDSFGSQYSNFLNTGKLGQKLSYVFGLGYGANDGYYGNRSGCVVAPSNSAQDNQPGSTGIIQFCGDLSGALFTKGELLKLKYDFSPVTSFEAGFVGSQAGYNPQGTAYGQYASNITIVPCLSNNTTCTNPNDSYYTGQTINGYIFYPGSKVYNTQPLFTGQLRTALGENTLLVRPYYGNISRIIDGSGESNYPQFYYPTGTPTKACTGPPNYGIVGPVQGNMTECLQGPFSVLESDKLKGTTFSFIHPMGASLIDATYDYHSDETLAYYQTPKPPFVVPDTISKFTTFALTGDFALRQNLRFKAGLYDTAWKLDGVQSIALAGGKTANAPLDRSVNRLDPHLALILQPSPGLSYRLAYGTSATFPYASLVSGSAFITRPSATAPLGTFTGKNPFLRPEVATEFDLGADKRFHSGAVLSLDLADNEIRDVFETISTPSTSPLYSFVNQPVNVAKLSAQSINLKFAYQPDLGLGYYLAASLARSIVNGVPSSFYTSPTAFVQPANGQQQCSNGGSQVCIPYLKSYGELQYIAHDRTLYQLGADFEGKNNTYNQPPFILLNFAARHPLNSTLDLQLAVENLLNTNNYANLAQPNSGIPQIGESSAGLGSILTPLIPAPPRNLRLQLEYHVGRP